MNSCAQTCQPNAVQPSFLHSSSKGNFQRVYWGQRTVRILWYIEKECFFPIIGGSSHSRAGQPAGATDRDANERKGEGKTSGSSVSVDAGVEMQ